MSIKNAFDMAAKDYDQARKQLIPCFDDFYGTALELIPFETKDRINVLDLGAGTGLFSSLVAHNSTPMLNLPFMIYQTKCWNRQKEDFQIATLTSIM